MIDWRDCAFRKRSHLEAAQPSWCRRKAPEQHQFQLIQQRAAIQAAKRAWPPAASRSIISAT